MKASICKLAALLLAVALLAGCSPAVPENIVNDSVSGETAQADASSDTSETDGSQPFSLAYEPAESLNPYSCMALNNRTILSLLYEPLFTVDSSFQAQPYLLEEYTVSGDGRTHTLTLRQGVTFSDGTTLTAADVVASLEAARGSSYYGQRLQHVLSITATSDQVVTIITDVACGTLPSLLNIYVVKASTTGSQIPTGTGPYTATDTQLTRSAWWRDTTPSVDEPTIRLVEVETAADTRDQFEYGAVTLACADPNAGTRIAYHSDFELWNNNTTVMQYIGFNLGSPVFVYSSLRAAVTYAVDRDSIVADTASGFATAAVLPTSPWASNYDSGLAATYAFDPAAFHSALSQSDIADHTGSDGVLELFTEAGTQPLTGTMIVGSSSEQRVAAAQAVVDALNSYGFQLTLEALEYEAYTEALVNGNFDLYYGEVRLSPDFDLSPFFTEGGSLSYGGIADAALVQLCAQATENAGNAYDLHEEILSRGMLCPVLFKTYAIYSARGRVTSLTPCLDGVFLTPIEQ